MNDMSPEQITRALQKAGVLPRPAPFQPPKVTHDSATRAALERAGAMSTPGYAPPRQATPNVAAPKSTNLAALTPEDLHVARILGTDLTALAAHKKKSNAAPIALPSEDSEIRLVALSARTRVGGNCPHPSSIKMLDGLGELALFCGACGRHQGHAA